MKQSDTRTISAILLFIIGIFAPISEGYGATYDNVPVKIQAAFFLKILAFNNNINKGSDISIYVINSPGFAEEMKKSLGAKVGKSKITAVAQGSDLPTQKPSAIYVGDSANLGKIIKYARSNKILSMTGAPDLVAKGVTLGICAAGGKPKILMNVSAAKEEGVNWNPVMLKISVIIK